MPFDELPLLDIIERWYFSACCGKVIQSRGITPRPTTGSGTGAILLVSRSNNVSSGKFRSIHFRMLSSTRG